MSRNNINNVTLNGRLTQNPKARVTPSGIHVCDFTIAVNRYSSGNKKYTDFIPCTAWNKTAEFIGHQDHGLKVGDFVLVQGRLTEDNFETIKGDSSTLTRGRFKVDQCSVDVLSRAQPKLDNQ